MSHVRPQLKMAERLVAHRLDQSMIERAFPLVAVLSPGLTLSRWNEFAKSFLVPRGGTQLRGFIGIQNVAGYILGLFSFEIRGDLQQRRTLSIDNIAIPNIPGRTLIWRALTDAIEDLATKNDCRLVCADLTGKSDRLDTDRKWIGLALEREGYLREEKTIFRRQTARSKPPFLSVVGLSE